MAARIMVEARVTPANVVRDSGTATGTQTATTLQDTSKVWAVNQWVGALIAIISGPGTGQIGAIATNTSDTLTLATALPTTTGDPPIQVSTVGTWNTTPVSGSSVYEIIAPAVGDDLRQRLDQWQQLDPTSGANLADETGVAQGGAQSATTLQDTSKAWTVNQWQNLTVLIMAGPGAGQVRSITSNSSTSLTVATPWTVIPVAGVSSYRILNPGPGTATGTQTATTLQDTSKNWFTGMWAGQEVRIISGPGTGQLRNIVSNTATTLTVTPAWDTKPVSGSSVYTIINFELLNDGGVRLRGRA